MIGTRVGPYEILAKVGEGGMGQVYRATDTRLKRQVALKILPASFATDRDRLARFQREAEVLASLNHPHIAQIYGFEESGGVSALVMELVEGEDLSQRLLRGAIPLDEALPIARQIAEALEAAHEQGIIHRDLKPANIKVRADGMVKVLDFGLAKAIEGTRLRSDAASVGQAGVEDFTQSPTITSPALMTGAGMILGTAAYMSPEQARGKTVDKRADIWAFGCVLFEMLTGRRAFGGEDITDTMAAVIRAEPDWSALPAETPPVLLRLLHCCLLKDAKARIADVSTIRYEIDAALVPEAHKASATIRERPARRAVWLVSAGVAGLLAGAGAMWLSRAGSSTTPDPPVVRASLLQAPGALMVNSNTPFVASLSPDGAFLAFRTQESGGRAGIWLRPLDAGEPRLLTSFEGLSSSSLIWSPDSRDLAFVTGTAVMRMSITGGSPVPVCEAPGGGSGGAWMADGRILFGSSAAASFGLRACPASGGKVEEVTFLDKERGEGGHSYPFLLPDNRHVLFTAYPPGGGQALGVYVGVPGSSERTLVLEGGSNAAYASGYLLFMRGTTLMAQALDPDTLKTSGSPRPLVEGVTTAGASGQTGAFTVSQTGVLVYGTGLQSLKSQLQWFDRTGKRLGVLGDPGLYRNPRLSPDDATVAVELTTESPRATHIWLVDVKRGVPTRVTFTPGIDASPLWSADGISLAYFTSAPKPAIVRQRITGPGASLENVLTVEGSGATTTTPQDFTANDAGLLLQGATTSGVMAFQLTLSDGKALPLFQSTSDFFGQPRVSPDGTALAYVSRESGSLEVYLQEFPAVIQKKRVSVSGGVQPVWRRDGRELYYLVPDGTLMAAPIQLGSTLTAGASVPLFKTTLDASSSLVIFHQYDVARDGRFLVNTTVDGNVLPPFTLVVNWPTLLKQNTTAAGTASTPK